MRYTKSRSYEPLEIARHLAAARAARDLSQAELAERAGLKRQQINYFETGARTPSMRQLLQIARALDLPLVRLLSGNNQVGCATRDIAVELKNLGLIDLWVESPTAPAAFRRAEEVVSLAVSGREPEARIVEGIPAVLAWNRWNEILLRAFARVAGRASLFRLAWLADVALTLERAGGFPGGCPGKEDLIAFLKRIKKPVGDRWDDLGRASNRPPTSPVWKRWRISYAGELADFRQRSQSLVNLAAVEGQRLST
jgi:putative transcriptional regulator